MESIILYLQNLPPSEFYKSLGILLYSTCTGLVPTNNDLSVAAGAFISQIKLLSPTKTALFCFLIWSLGETTSFFVGHFLGYRILKTKLLQKKLDEKKQIMLKKMINENLVQLIFAIRISPVLRSYTIVSLGALGLTPKLFFSRHIPILFVHSMVVFHAFYYLGPVLKSFFSENATSIFLLITIAWLAIMIFVGRNFYQKMSNEVSS
jgi:membrane protein DedA with SNARE-associated domain